MYGPISTCHQIPHDLDDSEASRSQRGGEAITEIPISDEHVLMLHAWGFGDNCQIRQVIILEESNQHLWDPQSVYAMYPLGNAHLVQNKIHEASARACQSSQNLCILVWCPSCLCRRFSLQDLGNDVLDIKEMPRKPCEQSLPFCRPRGSLSLIATLCPFSAKSSATWKYQGRH